MSKKETSPVIAEDHVISKIYTVRGQKVMLDRDLAELYGVETKRVNEQVKRNCVRFPEDFMFELTQEEWEILKSQIATSSWGGRRTLPSAFGQEGMATPANDIEPRYLEILNGYGERAKEPGKGDQLMKRFQRWTQIASTSESVDNTA